MLDLIQFSRFLVSNRLRYGSTLLVAMFPNKFLLYVESDCPWCLIIRTRGAQSWKSTPYYKRYELIHIVPFSFPFLHWCIRSTDLFNIILCVINGKNCINAFAIYLRCWNLIDWGRNWNHQQNDQQHHQSHLEPMFIVFAFAEFLMRIWSYFNPIL